MEFFDGGVSLGTVSAAPYRKTVSNLRVAVHSFYAKVYAGTAFKVTNIASVPLMLVVTPSLPARSVAELVAYAKAHPGRLSFASSSNGGAPHLAGEQFKLMAGVDMAHVPYRGSGQAVPDLIAGNVQVMFDSMPSSAAASGRACSAMLPSGATIVCCDGRVPS